MYGDSEDLLGKWFARHPGRRADIFLATKFALSFGKREDGTMGLLIDSSPANCRAQCEQSLRRLGVESIDLYYIHRVDGKTPVEETMREMVKLREYVPPFQTFPSPRNTHTPQGKARSSTSASRPAPPPPSAARTPSPPSRPTKSSTPPGHSTSKAPRAGTSSPRAAPSASPSSPTPRLGAAS